MDRHPTGRSIRPESDPRTPPTGLLAGRGLTGHLRKTPKTADRVAELEDELKQRDRRIEKLKHELDEARDLVRRKRRKRGESLQHIADETSLGMQTVRTIIGKANGHRSHDPEAPRPDQARGHGGVAGAQADPSSARRASATLKARLRLTKGLGYVEPEADFATKIRTAVLSDRRRARRCQRAQHVPKSGFPIRGQS